jgi:hypothetical protein
MRLASSTVIIFLVQAANSWAGVRDPLAQQWLMGEKPIPSTVKLQMLFNIFFYNYLKTIQSYLNHGPSVVGKTWSQTPTLANGTQIQMRLGD